MIKILGIKRIIILGALLGINLLFAGVLYWYMNPEMLKQQKALNALKGQVSTLQSDIQRLQIEFTQLEGQKERFAEIKELGFFNQQGRREVELLLPDVQKNSGAVKAVTGVQPGFIEKSSYAEKANHEILTSTITANIGAMDDPGIYRYIYMLDEALPGHLLIESISMKRNRDVNAELLKSIIAGAVPEMVSADVRLTWRTMIPKDLGEDVEGQE